MLRAHIPKPPPPLVAASQRIAAANLQRHETPDERKQREYYDQALARQIERQHQTGVTL